MGININAHKNKMSKSPCYTCLLESLTLCGRKPSSPHKSNNVYQWACSSNGFHYSNHRLCPFKEKIDKRKTKCKKMHGKLQMLRKHFIPKVVVIGVLHTNPSRNSPDGSMYISHQLWLLNRRILYNKA